MVSPAMLDQIDPDSPQIGGQQREITTLFADIRGFTSFSEKNSPEILSRCSTSTLQPVQKRSSLRKVP